MAPSQLKIKSSALGRLLKDISLYKSELKEQQAVVDGLKSKNLDQDEELEYQLKKQIQILQETKNLIPTLESKAKDYKKDLKEYIDVNAATLSEDQLAEAKVVLEDAEKLNI